MKELLLHYARFGPYHKARLQSAQRILQPFGWRVRGLQICSSDSTYAWNEIAEDEGGSNEESASDRSILTVFPGAHYESLSRQELYDGVLKVLDQANPNAICVAGWSATDAKACLKWCMIHNRKRLLMSETRRVDGNRVWWKEILKKQIVKRFDGGLVGSESHADYLRELGMAPDQIAYGYNVVDNEYFIGNVDRLRNASTEHDDARTMPPFFLASNRFVSIKNLERCIAAFAKFAQSKADHSSWNLCLLGDGPLHPQIVETAREGGLRVEMTAPWDDLANAAATPTIYFPGFAQISELPRFYAEASAFLHPAISEPWGLVINEAMASGLPIIASQNGGAAETLLEHGQTGYCFAPTEIDDIHHSLETFAALSARERESMGTEARRILLDRMPTSKFGCGLLKLLEPGSQISVTS